MLEPTPASVGEPLFLGNLSSLKALNLFHNRDLRLEAVLEWTAVSLIAHLVLHDSRQSRGFRSDTRFQEDFSLPGHFIFKMLNVIWLVPESVFRRGMGFVIGREIFSEHFPRRTFLEGHGGRTTRVEVVTRPGRVDVVRLTRFGTNRNLAVNNQRTFRASPGQFNSNVELGFGELGLLTPLTRNVTSNSQYQYRRK